MINVAQLINYIKFWLQFRNHIDPFWKKKWESAINKLLEDLPHGSGINHDAGIQLDLENSTPETLRFTFSYQHMNDHGAYDGWTHHELIIQPSLTNGFDLQVTGEDKDGIIDYLEEMFYDVFYYEPDYHKQNWLGKRYLQLKKMLERITPSWLFLKKAPARF